MELPLGLGCSAAEQLRAEGRAVPAVLVLALLGRQTGKLYKLLRAMSVNQRLCECMREELKREISNKSKLCQSFWHSLELTCDA